uniref:Uncharacterized protein n=1 Tax=Nelumbo nucifera TaxID=4432 RepID=A0A822XI73_NELNU|nr:TPA_asm: hypothetical protein HUJ06_020294 [Nelumbo nucifera]
MRVVQGFEVMQMLKLDRCTTKLYAPESKSNCFNLEAAFMHPFLKRSSLVAANQGIMSSKSSGEYKWVFATLDFFRMLGISSNPLAPTMACYYNRKGAYSDLMHACFNVTHIDPGCIFL